jgi:hypothetical protein
MSIPRIYGSFAEFEREERLLLGLPPIVEVLPAPVVDPTPTKKPAMPPVITLPVTSPPEKTRAHTPCKAAPVTARSLRLEGILEIGCPEGTSVLYVRTLVKLHLLHVTWLPDRVLDDYAVQLAMAWIEGHGMSSYEVAQNLGVGQDTLRKALAAAGYERVNPKQYEALVIARGARKIANRRGRLVQKKITPENPGRRRRV